MFQWGKKKRKLNESRIKIKVKSGRNKANA